MENQNGFTIKKIALPLLIKFFTFGLLFCSFIQSARAQAVMVKDIVPGSTNSDPYSLINVNGTLFFNAFALTYGRELWKSDGTTTGTTMTKNIGPGSFNGISQTASTCSHCFTVVNGTLFFQGSTGITNGRELWKSDGTDTGTVMVKDIYPGGNYSDPRYLTDVNGTLFFSATASNAQGVELWKSDGTTTGTVLVKDINPGVGDSHPLALINVNGTLFFHANDGSHGYELWKSDGTAAGTVMVKDINPGSIGSHPLRLVNMNGTLFFLAGDNLGYGLWKSDGTAAGTVFVKSLYYGSGSIPDKLIAVNGTLFFPAEDSINGVELWKSDGTTAGTVMVKDINPGSASSISAGAEELIEVANNTLFFRADNGTHGEELWKSDGTAAGTVMVKDINSGSADSHPYYLTEVNGTLFFVASDVVHGGELWQSDGTTAGTVLVQDIIPGSVSSFIYDITEVNGSLFFTARDSAHGSELWKLDLVAPPPPSGLEFVVGIDTAGAGDTVTLPIFVNNFNGIATFQGTITFDSTIFIVDTVISPNPNVANNFGMPGVGSVPANSITFSWFDPALNTTTLPDSTVVIEITFVVSPSPPIGFTDVEIDSSATLLGYSDDPNATSFLIPNVTQGGIEILDTELPTISCPAPITQNVDPGSCGAIVSFATPIGVDNLPGHVVSQISGPISGAAFPVGTTPITFQVTDAAGNIDSCTFDVLVIDNEPPTVLTQNITVELDTSGTISITAADIDNGSFDICGIASLSLDIDQFDCSDVGTPLTVTLTVIDLNGNSASATAIVTVESNPIINLSGASISEIGDSIPGVNFDLNGDDGPLVQTGSNFNFLASACISVNDIGGDKIDDAATNNGVDVLDAFEIVRHVLLVQPFSSPYKLIAADVNATSSINTLDVFEVMKKVANITTHFTNPTTGSVDAIWTFIPADHVFTNPANPYGFDTRRFYFDPSPSMGQDFVGVKLGDVNNSWNPAQLRTATPIDSIHFDIDVVAALPGELITIPVRVRNFNSITAYQFTMNWDPSVLAFQSVNDKTLTGLYGTDQVQKGIFTSAWIDMGGQSVTIADGTLAFEMVFEVVGPWGSETRFEINSAITPSKAFNSTETLLGVGTAPNTFKVSGSTAIDPYELKGYKLSQNMPNPFSQSTSLVFSLGQTEEVKIAIYNLTGQVIKRFSGKYPAGEHKLAWNGNNENGSEVSQGIYMVQIRAGGFVSSIQLLKAQ